LVEAVALVLLLAAGCASHPPPLSNQATAVGAPPAIEAAVSTVAVVGSTVDGGVLALGGDRSEAMRTAELYMHEACGTRGYAITREGLEGANEWRVHYRCGP
jgi:hypothetical protein